ncbi:MAG TPA: hypothetical protein VED40_10475 [Azospirillaceae bacterium]|nr:hypothetical protein [Azospirillaceae bacterium]
MASKGKGRGIAEPAVADLARAVGVAPEAVLDAARRGGAVVVVTRDGRKLTAAANAEAA